MPDCKACAGAWWHRPDSPAAPGEAFWEGHDVACAACCSIPGSEAVVKFAHQWLGFDPWAAVDPRAAAWLPGADWGPWWSPTQHIIPLHLRAGFDLGTRLLAHRLGADVEASCWFGPAEKGPVWWLEARRHRTDPTWWCFNPAPLIPDRRCIPTPRISQLPSDLSPRIRAAAALALAWEAVKEVSTPTDSGGD